MQTRPVGWLENNHESQCERHASLGHLRDLDAADWPTDHVHPKLGGIHAGDLLAAWGAHDLLHLRQIGKRRYQLIERESGDDRTIFAGEWVAHTPPAGPAADAAMERAKRRTHAVRNRA